MSYEDLVVFENELNDDIPPEYIDDYYDNYQKILNKQHNKPQFFNNRANFDLPIEHNVQSLYDYDDSDNVYDVNSDKLHKSKKTSYDIKSKESDFKICEELFQTNREEEIFNDLMKIYENPNETKAEFSGITFKLDMLPPALLCFKHLTELVVKKCDLSELDVLPPNIQKIVFNNCGLKIISCQHFPNSLKHIDFCNNELEIFSDVKKTITHLYLDNNNLQYIHDIPEDSQLKVLSIKNNKIKNIDFLVDINLTELYLNNNCIEDISVLSNTIEILEISKNNIFTISVLPENLKTLIAFHCKINKFLFELPYFLEKLDLYNNNLEDLPEFNKFLKWLDISSNDLRKLPSNIAQLDYCDISCNANLVFDPSDPNWIIFMESKNKTYIMDKQDDYILKSDTISTISSSSEDDSDCSEESDDSGVTVDSKDSSDIENFKLKIKNNTINNNNNTDSDKLDEEFIPIQELNVTQTVQKSNLNDSSWIHMLNSVEQDNNKNNKNNKNNEDEIVTSLLDNMKINNTLQSSVTNIIDSFKPKEKRIVKTLKTFTM